MIGSYIEGPSRLTGRTRVRIARERVGVFKTREVCVMQVEEAYSWSSAILTSLGDTNARRWRDVRPSDLSLAIPATSANAEENAA